MTLVRVVEDDQLICDLLRMQLEHDGFDVAVTSRDFPILLAPELWEGVSCAVVDLQLNDNEINGVEVLAYLTSHHPGVRRVVLSAISVKDIPGLIAELGPYADKVLRKPSDFADIIRAVRGE